MRPGSPHCVFLALSPLVLLIADALLSMAIADYVTAAPNVLGAAAIICVAGIALYALVQRRIVPRLCVGLAVCGYIGVVLSAPLYLAAGIQAHETAGAGPLQRAQIVRVEGHGGHRSIRRQSTTFALADGSRVVVRGRPGGRNCYAVRRIQGTGGFAWLRIVEAAPMPGTGQLNWPIRRETCFSDSPISSMRG